MKFYSCLLSAFCCMASLNVYPDVPLSEQQEPEDLIIYNRILAKVNGKTISVIDVMKKMDMFLQRNYPHLIHSKAARFQFYSSQWQDFLTQIIDTELMLADAEKLEIKVSEADVREEILNRFGSNIMPTLDEIDMSYEEVKQIIHDEIVVQRMMWFRVNSKALSRINSQDVKEGYKQYCAKHPEMQQWNYQVLSIRSPNQNISEMLASRAMDLLHSKLELSALSTQLKAPDETTTVTLSPDIEADERSISTSHKQVLLTLSENSFSEPIAQVSRVDNSVVYRIFHLKKYSKLLVPPFEKMADKIKEQLLQEAANKENAQYAIKLREKFGFNEKQMMETLPKDFQPFRIR